MLKCIENVRLSIQNGFRNSYFYEQLLLFTMYVIPTPLQIVLSTEVSFVEQ